MKLKSCPFCGCRVEMFTTQTCPVEFSTATELVERTKRSYFVWCKSCYTVVQLYADSEEFAVGVWNRRF